MDFYSPILIESAGSNPRRRCSRRYSVGKVREKPLSLEGVHCSQENQVVLLLRCEIRVGNALPHQRRDDHRIARNDILRRKIAYLDTPRSGQNIVSLGRAGEPVPSGRDPRRHPGPGDGDVRIVRGVGRFEDITALFRKVFTGRVWPQDSCTHERFPLSRIRRPRKRSVSCG